MQPSKEGNNEHAAEQQPAAPPGASPAETPLNRGAFPIRAGEPEESKRPENPEDPEVSKSAYYFRAAADFLLVLFGAVFVPYILLLIIEQSHAAFFADIAPEMKQRAKGNVGTLTIAMSAVLGVLDWTFNNREEK